MARAKGQAGNRGRQSGSAKRRTCGGACMNDSLGHIFIDAALINNFVLCVFLGMCSFLGLSQKFSTAWRMGVSVMFVITVSGVLSYGAHVLLATLHVEYLR